MFVAPRRVFVALEEGVRRSIARVDAGDVVFTCVCLLLINRTRTCKEPTSILRRCNGATNTLLVATNTLLVTTNTLQWAHGLSEAPGTVLVPPQEGVRSGYEHPPRHQELSLYLHRRVFVAATNTLPSSTEGVRSFGGGCS